MAGFINSKPEFGFMGAFTVTSCLMGPDCKFIIRQWHQESCNLFTLCLCKPGTGNTEAYKITVEDPLEDLPENLLVQDYTTKGIFEHLKNRDGKAIICHTEMTRYFEHSLKKQSDGESERQTFCRFHDGNSKVIRMSHGKPYTSKKDGQDEREFCQPQPYLNLHQMLGVLDDGFLDRISTCIIDSVIRK